MTLLKLDRVGRTFQVRHAAVNVVDDVTIEVHKGEILCLVGESGCGKTTTGRIAAGLLAPTSGAVYFEGEDVRKMDHAAYRRYRHAVQIIQQDPYASLNPRQSVGTILSTPLLHHRFARSRPEAHMRVINLLEMVELTPPASFLDKYPHQLSGGQRQRIAVARALTMAPSFIVADEPVSMLDTSIRISLLKLLRRLRDEKEVAFLFITHDLALAKYFAWDGLLAIMYSGRIVEVGTTLQVINHPNHPYTRALLAALPTIKPGKEPLQKQWEPLALEGPSFLKIPTGCTFHPRCPLHEQGLCETSVPSLVRVEQGTKVACHVITRQYPA